jgi:hypothetical protein
MIQTDTCDKDIYARRGPFAQVGRGRERACKKGDEVRTSIRAFAGVLACANFAMALGFHTEPAVHVSKPMANFDVGEGAINSALNYEARNGFTLNSPADGAVNVTVRKVSVDFEEGSCTVDLRLVVTYHVGGSGPLKSTFVSYQNSLATNGFTHSIVDGKKRVRVWLPQFENLLYELPYGVQNALKAKFQNLEVYAYGLIANSGSVTQPPEAPPTGKQLSEHTPIFYMGEGDFTAEFKNDFARFSAGPHFEVEAPTIQIHHQSAGGGAHKLTLVTNFKAEIRTMSARLNSGSSFSLQADSLRLGPDLSEPVLRKRRYNLVIRATNLPLTQNHVTFYVSLASTTRDYMAGGGFLHRPPNSPYWIATWVK